MLRLVKGFENELVINLRSEKFEVHTQTENRTQTRRFMVEDANHCTEGGVSIFGQTRVKVM